MPGEGTGRGAGGRRVGDPGRRGEPVDIRVDGARIPAFAGETIGAVLLAGGVLALRRTRHGGRPRGLFCCMGVCYECLVTVDDEGSVRACMTQVRDGMSISTDLPPEGG